jgi:hypothetical protein
MALTFQNFYFFFEVLRVVPRAFVSLGEKKIPQSQCPTIFSIQSHCMEHF